MLDTYHKIENTTEFLEKIKKEAIRTFLLSYKDSKDFIKKYNETLLTLDDVFYEAKSYLIKRNSSYFMDSERLDNLIKAVYQQLVFKIMSKLVDDGILELCWDMVVSDFMWRKKKYARIGKVKTKKL